MTKHTPIPAHWKSTESDSTFEVTEIKLPTRWEWHIEGDGSTGYVTTDEDGEFVAHGGELVEGTHAIDLIEAFSLIVGEEVEPA